MTDRRLQPPDRRGDGDPMRVAVPVAPLLDADGNRQREILFGQSFRRLSEDGDRVWGFAEHDGYLGWVPATALDRPLAPTHRVAAIRTYARNQPDLKATGADTYLSFGSLLTITGFQGDWARADHPSGPIHLPAAHIGPVGARPKDPVAIAELFLGTPYLWGGNSAFGIDCSGLVQAAALACGIACPGDSDQQQVALSYKGQADAPTARGGLFFWKGHVAIAIDADRLIHANAHHMAVAVEPIAGAIARIGPPSARGRF